MLERLNQAIQQDSIKAAVAELNAILVMLDEGVHAIGGGVVERIEIDQVETAFGGCRVVAAAVCDVGEHPLVGARVDVGAA